MEWNCGTPSWYQWVEVVLKRSYAFNVRSVVNKSSSRVYLFLLKDIYIYISDFKVMPSKEDKHTPRFHEIIH